MNRHTNSEVATPVVEVLIQRIDDSVPLPTYAHPGDAGADLVTTVDITLQPGERAMVPTGVSLALPAGYVALVHPRSGLAASCGVSIVNAPGTIDAGYRGEVKVVLINLDPSQPVSLGRGDRIAQLVFQQVARARFVEVDTLPGSDRGAGGYGSTGGFASRIASQETVHQEAVHQEAVHQEAVHQEAVHQETVHQEEVS